MKAPKEIRAWINRRRSESGKKSGVVRWLFDAPIIERKLATNKKLSPPKE